MRRLGGGGVGDVYLAEGPAQGGASGLAAVKVLHGSAADETARAIAQQAHAVSTLHLTHVLPIYGVGEEGGAIYVAMDYAPGGSLGAAVGPSRGGTLQLPLAMGVVARLITQAARAVQAVHEHGLVHGDLKPDNLFVRTAPQGGPLAAVADFGQSAVIRAAAAAAAAGDNTWAGTALLCAAPEQLSGQAMPASDQYALATIAYLLLTGRYPFSGDARTLGLAVLHEPAPPPTHIDPSMSRATEAALLRALAKLPAARFPDVATFVQALDEGLAAGKGPGVSQVFSLLAGAAPAGGAAAQPALGETRPHAAVGAYASPPGGNASGIRRTQAVGHVGSAASGAHRAGGPQPAPGLWRRMTARQRTTALVACAIAVIMVAVGGVGLRALTAAPGTAAPQPNFGGLDFAPTFTPNTLQVANDRKVAQVALAKLTAATSKPPLFSDNLKNNGQHWPVDGRSTFFGTDGRLHLLDQTTHDIVTLDQPVSAPGDIAVTVDLTFLRGSVGDPAGLRFRVAPDADGTTSFYAALVAPDGRFEFWRFNQSHWTILSGGYTNTIRRGLGQTNTLAVLVDPADLRGYTFLVFINGQYVADAVDDVLPSGSAMGMGPIVIYPGTEIGYANYAVYAAKP
jgi:hypothetical protein